MEGKLAMAGISRAYKRRGNMIANTGGPVLCLDAGSRLSYPGSLTTWTDLSGNGNTGTLTNGPTFSSANGGAIVFDGADDYASTPFSLSGYSAFTCAAWIKTTTGNREIMATYGLGNIFEFWLDSNYVSIYAYGTSTGTRFSASNVLTGNWVYCVGIYNGVAGTISIYVNGVLDQSSQLGTVPATVNVFAQNVVIGNVNSGNYYFNGSMGQASIYNRALSAAEISTNFNLLRGRYFKVTPSVEYLVVAGGGGGGSRQHGGGGGAGGFRTATGFSVASGSSITVTVGAGGAGGAGGGNNQGVVGSNSVFSTITSNGGGAGGGYNIAGGSGGSGGGAGANNATVGTGTAGQGNNGGAYAVVNGPGSGGGGATAVGANASGTYAIGYGGAGGNGTASSISGSSVTRSGGGGGGGTSNAGTSLLFGAGGSGGGGAGNGISGTINSGGGGGGNSSDGAGGSGGAGIAIIRYADSYDAAASTTGSPTVTVAGGYRVYSWIGSGSITF